MDTLISTIIVSIFSAIIGTWGTLWFMYRPILIVTNKLSQDRSKIEIYVSNIGMRTARKASLYKENYFNKSIKNLAPQAESYVETIENKNSQEYWLSYKSFYIFQRQDPYTIPSVETSHESMMKNIMQSIHPLLSNKVISMMFFISKLNRIKKIKLQYNLRIDIAAKGPSNTFITISDKHSRTGLYSYYETFLVNEEKWIIDFVLRKFFNISPGRNLYIDKEIFQNFQKARLIKIYKNYIQILISEYSSREIYDKLNDYIAKPPKKYFNLSLDYNLKYASIELKPSSTPMPSESIPIYTSDKSFIAIEDEYGFIFAKNAEKIYSLIYLEDFFDGVSVILHDGSIASYYMHDRILGFAKNKKILKQLLDSGAKSLVKIRRNSIKEL